MKTILYLGIEKPDFEENVRLIHFPIIKTIPRPENEYMKAFDQFLSYGHIIFTSKTSVDLFFKILKNFSFSKDEIQQKQYIVVGKATAQRLNTYGINQPLIAKNETAEGLIELLKTLSLKNCYIFWPHSALSRNILPDFFLENNLKFEDCIIYDTIPFLPKSLPDLAEIDEIVFTSPSTVDAFLKFFPDQKLNQILTPIGPVTKLRLEKSFA
jgi:uroporphyrinogen-III synthase